MKLLLAIVLLLPYYFTANSYASSDDKRMTTSKIVVIGFKGSEIQKFAQFFNQDWKDLFSTFLEGVELYVEPLSGERRKLLHEQLQKFIDETRGQKNSDIEEKWYGLGAQAWEPDWDIKDGLTEMLSKI